MTMSMFSFNTEDAVVVPAEMVEETVETVKDHYADETEEDYTSVEEPDFGDEV